jgi:hypothetical protein
LLKAKFGGDILANPPDDTAVIEAVKEVVTGLQKQARGEEEDYMICSMIMLLKFN